MAVATAEPNTDRSTAFDRYARYIAESKTTLWGRVVSIIALAGEHGITDSEGARRLNMTYATYARRRRELRQMGLVVDSGEVRNGRTVWTMK